MRQARDTFLRYLADNLPGVEVRNVRRDKNSLESSRIRTGAVNVQFIGDASRVNDSNLFTTIDVVADDELDAVNMMQTVSSVLNQGGMIPLLDYTDTSNPVRVGTSQLFWNPNQVSFKPVYSDLYSRFSCFMMLTFHS
jgi:hypothetical protein